MIRSLVFVALLLLPANSWAVAFVADAAVTWQFSGPSDSVSRTIPVADGILLGCGVFNGNTDTVTATIAGTGPVESYQSEGDTGEINYLAVFIGAPSGSQTVAISGLDSGDGISCGFKGLTAVHTTDPFSNPVNTNTALGSGLGITTTADGIAVGMMLHGSTASVASSNTEQWESPLSANHNMSGNVGSAAGTGGTVTLVWTGTPLYFISGFNLNNAVAVDNVGFFRRRGAQ